MIRSTLSVTKHTPSARALVAAEHPLGAEVGAGILARGGNAVDAAVATAFAMTVVEPFMSSVAGGGTMLVHLAKRGETIALDFNVQAPAACHESCYELGEGVAQALFPWRKVVGDANNFGPKSVAIPGSVAGLCLALEQYGTMDLADVMAPAIELAEKGFEVDWYHTLTIAPHCDELDVFPETARSYLRDGHYVYRPASSAPADVLRQPDLGRSLRLIAKDGPTAFYRGAIAQAIDEEMRRTGGFLRASDLADYAPRVVEPLTMKYRGLELAFSPGATGGPTAVEMLNILAQFPAAKVGYETAGGCTCARKRSAMPSSTGCGTWPTRSWCACPGAGSPPARTRRRWRRACGAPGRGARPSCRTRGRTTRRSAGSAAGRWRWRAAGAGCPPTATTAPRTSARWIASATWSR